MNLTDSVTAIRGVGPKKAEILEKLNIKTIGDVISYFPRSYQDRRSFTKISELEPGSTKLVKARIVKSAANNYSSRKRVLRVIASDESGGIEIIFFNANYLVNVLKKGMEFCFYGPVRLGKMGIQMVNPDFFRPDAEERMGIVPVYPLTRGISQNELRKLTASCTSGHMGIDEFLPVDVREKHSLCTREEAIKAVHYPADKKNLLEARYRIAFDEFLMLQLRIQMSKRSRGQGKAPVFDINCDTEDYTGSFPYEMTGAQKKAIMEIREDVCSGKAMNRLVQGDVGSGKTAVAETALYLAVKSGYQGVLMAPTEILARQHFETCSRNLANFGIRTECLTGSVSAGEKKEILDRLKNGEIDVLIGTHAIIQENVEFKKLGLVITDEQHRFGVRQRDSLRGKGENPHVLVMTATPIPRTLAIVLYADMDISVIDELPPGRKKIETFAVDEGRRDRAYEFVEEQLSQGHQAYVVAPLIEDSEAIEASSAESLYDELKKRFKNYRVELLHGAMKQADKDAVMGRFHEGKTDVLVSTVVIEVGINVPNATVMVIENTERFGLAQLHQLRGRIGRGESQSYCWLVQGSKSEISEKRAEIMVNSNDGFYIAEQDLDMRGPGELSGTRQHGIPDLRMGDLVKHISIMKEATKEAEVILKEDPELESVKYASLRMMVEGETPVI